MCLVILYKFVSENISTLLMLCLTVSKAGLAKLEGHAVGYDSLAGPHLCMHLLRRREGGKINENAVVFRQ